MRRREEGADAASQLTVIYTRPPRAPDYSSNISISLRITPRVARYRHRLLRLLPRHITALPSCR